MCRCVDVHMQIRECSGMPCFCSKSLVSVRKWHAPVRKWFVSGREWHVFVPKWLVSVRKSHASVRKWVASHISTCFRHGKCADWTKSKVEGFFLFMCLLVLTLYACMEAHMHICSHVCMYGGTSAYMLAGMHVWRHIYIYARMYACMEAHMHMCPHVCMYHMLGRGVGCGGAWGHNYSTVALPGKSRRLSTTIFHLKCIRICNFWLYAFLGVRKLCCVFTRLSAAGPSVEWFTYDLVVGTLGPKWGYENCTPP